MGTEPQGKDEQHQSDIPGDDPTKQGDTTKRVLVNARDAIRQLPVVKAAVESNTADIEKLKTQNELGMKRMAQWFSVYVFTVRLSVEVWFSYLGKPLVLTPFLDQISMIFIIAPWCGSGLGRLVNILSNKFGDKT